MFLSKHFARQLCQFVPNHKPPSKIELQYFNEFLKKNQKILVLTGAGVSTESGIPDYRSEGVGMYNRTNYKPINYTTFLQDKEARTRYWARNYLGWTQFKSKQPNKTHWNLAKFDWYTGKINGLITQNVDGLHHKGGSKNVIELHGNAYWVHCLSCRNVIPRPDFQTTLQEINPNILHSDNYSLRPDGDIDIDEEIYKTFVVPDCEKCGGILKPTIVFFGENIPEKRIKKVEKLVNDSDALLVMGTTLSTLSSSRIVKQAYDLCKIICIVNIGPTKMDQMADILINCKCSDLFPDKMLQDL